MATRNDRDRLHAMELRAAELERSLISARVALATEVEKYVLLKKAYDATAEEPIIIRKLKDENARLSSELAKTEEAMALWAGHADRRAEENTRLLLLVRQTVAPKSGELFDRYAVERLRDVAQQFCDGKTFPEGFVWDVLEAVRGPVAGSDNSTIRQPEPAK